VQNDHIADGAEDEFDEFDELEEDEEKEQEEEEEGLAEEKQGQTRKDMLEVMYCSGEL
jgi:hypothetical protein